MFTTVRRWFAKEPRAELVDALGEASLPSFQPAVVRVLQRLRDPNSSAKALGQAVSADPGLSLKILRLANSAGAGLKRRVDNVGHAATLLGRTGLESIVLGVAVQGAIGGPPAAQAAFWRVAARRAATARAIAERIAPASAPLCFAGGLLQDMAIPLLMEARAPYSALVAEAGSTPDLAPLERERFGWTHADVAGWLCEAWGFPEGLRRAIQGHHGDAADDGGNGAPVAVQVVALVDGATDDPEPVVEAARARYDLRPDLVVHALERGREQGEELAAALR